MMIVKINLSDSKRTYTEEEKLKFRRRYKDARATLEKAIRGYEKAKREHNWVATLVADSTLGLSDEVEESLPGEPEDQLELPARYRKAGAVLSEAEQVLSAAQDKYYDAATAMAEVELGLRDGCSSEADQLERFYQLERFNENDDMMAAAALNRYATPWDDFRS